MRRGLSALLAKALLALVVLAPPLLIALLIRKYAVNLPVNDDWALVPTIERLHAGQLSVVDLWAQHNEHRLLFPRMAMLALASVSHWDIRWELFASLAIAVMIFALLADMARVTLAASPAHAAVVLALMSWTFFSPMQWENWLWGWQIQWFLCVFAVVWVFYVFARTDIQEQRAVWLGVPGAVVATYSLGSGFIVWPVALGMLLAQRRTASSIAIWCAAAVVTVGTYLYHYQTPPGHPSPTLFLHEPKAFITWMLVYLGEPLAEGIKRVGVRELADVARDAVGIGALSLAAFAALAIVLLKRATRAVLPWLALATYALLGDVLTAVSRLGFGPGSALASRYVTTSSLFLIALIVMAAMALTMPFRRRPSSSFLHGALFAAATLLFVEALAANYAVGIHWFERRSDQMAAVRSCIDAPIPSERCYADAFYEGADSTIMAGRVAYLRSIHWGGF